MSCKRSVYVVVFGLTLFAMGSGVHAQATDSTSNGDDEYEWKEWKHWRHSRHSRHGNALDGLFQLEYGYDMFKNKGLNDLATSMGLGTFEDGMIGGSAYGLGNVGGNWYIGGGGFWGGARTTGVYTNPTDGSTYNREVGVNFGGGGLILEFDPIVIGPVQAGVGSMLGGGGMTVRMRQDTGTFDWPALTSQYVGNATPGENIITEVDRGFWAARPYAVVRVRVLDWLALSGTVGYQLDSMSKSGWEFDGKEISGSGPDVDLHKPYFHFGVVLGG